MCNLKNFAVFNPLFELGFVIIAVKLYKMLRTIYL